MPLMRWLPGTILLLGGCESLQLFEEPKTATVSSNPFGMQADSRGANANYQPADPALAARVDGLGRKLVVANPEMGLKTTMFATIGNAPQPEVFHVGPHIVYVTDSLVRRCGSEAELASALAMELGKIVSEREAAATPDMRNPERMPPIQVPIGNAGQITNSDLVHQVELGKFEKERPRTRKHLPRPDPDHLARTYLEKAGFERADLDAAQPLLQAAQNNAILERQFKGVIVPNAWTP